MEELPGVKEALSRLPQSVTDERFFRIKRVRPDAWASPCPFLVGPLQLSAHIVQL